VGNLRRRLDRLAAGFAKRGAPSGACPGCGNQVDPATAERCSELWRAATVPELLELRDLQDRMAQMIESALPRGAATSCEVCGAVPTGQLDRLATGGGREEVAAIRERLMELAQQISDRAAAEILS
jgi:hypothetical protein